MWEGTINWEPLISEETLLPTNLATCADQIVHFDTRISLSGLFDGLLAESVLLGEQSTCTGSSLDWWSLPIRIFRYTVEGWSVCLLNQEFLQSKQEGIIKFSHISTLTFPMHIIQGYS